MCKGPLENYGQNSERLIFAFGLESFYSLTRAVYSPMSDPGKAVLPACLVASCLLLPGSCLLPPAGLC